MRSYTKELLVSSMILASIFNSVIASDHDDGETDLKGRALNLTDVYAFREDKEISGGSANHVIFLINSNPRSLPQQQYYFSTQARYELNISRVGTSKDVPAKTDANIIIRAEFGVPNPGGAQPITITSVIDGATTVYTANSSGGDLMTTPLASGNAPVVSRIAVGGQELGVFAGLRKDPFFFDVTAFFKFRSAAAKTGGEFPVPGFSQFPIYTPNGVEPQDFTAEYNANTIALRIPVSMLQSGASETVFDSWATISVPQ